MKRQATHSVRFHQDVLVWQHAVVLGDNPACRFGAPVALDWNHTDGDDSSNNSNKPLHIPLLHFQRQQEHRYAVAMVERRRRRQKHEYAPQGPPIGRLSYYQRQDLLHQAGYTDEQLHAAERTIRRQQKKRAWTLQRTLPVRSVERVRRGWTKLVTGRGTVRHRNRLIQQWYDHYSALQKPTSLREMSELS